MRVLASAMLLFLWEFSLPNTRKYVWIADILTTIKIDVDSRSTVLQWNFEMFNLKFAIFIEEQDCISNYFDHLLVYRKKLYLGILSWSKYINKTILDIVVNVEINWYTVWLRTVSLETPTQPMLVFTSLPFIIYRIYVIFWHIIPLSSSSSSFSSMHFLNKCKI